MSLDGGLIQVGFGPASTWLLEDIEMMKRREFLAQGAAVVTAAGWIQGQSAVESNLFAHDPSGERRVRQSVMGWCFKPMGSVELGKECVRIGLEAMEGIPSTDYAAVTELGLKISLVGSHGFQQGPVDPENHAMVEAKLREGIDLAVRYGAPNVITFTGMATKGISDEAARKNCLRCWKNVIGYAEEKRIGLVLEHLNSRDASHPMKGHPGYWGDRLERCVELVNAVGSERFKLLFDIYHVQIMEGDLIRNIHRYQSLVGHYHTAGNPGRGELDDSQEINYPAVIRAIVATGYRGYIAQEFIPTSDDPIGSLEQAVRLCDV